MKNLLTTALILCIVSSASAQFYYKDVMATQDNNQTMKLYTTYKVQSVTARGFDGYGAPSTDFSETQTITGNKIRLSSRNKVSVANQYFSYNDKQLLTSVTDTTSGTISSTTYTYNAQNNVVSIQNTVIDNQDSIFENEKHVWQYNNNGRPEKMFRIVNNADTTEIWFKLDENGNVVEEQPYKKYRPDKNVYYSGEKIYYYYDDKNRLTDIVRYNAKSKRLLPDYMFEYSDDNKVVQKVTTLGDMGLNYLYWRYAYNEQGLKTKEVTFNRDKESTGRIEYTYKFAQ